MNGALPIRRTRAIRRRCAWAALVCALAYGHDAWAVADCEVISSGVGFDVYDPLASAPDDSTGSVTVLCTHLSGGADQIGYRASLSTGNSGRYAMRQLRDGADRLDYNLYTNAAHTIVWGDGSGATGVMSGSLTIGPGIGNQLRIATGTVYGRMPARQDALDGSYSDTIIVTLEF